MGSTSVLMCPPRFYGVDYEINPWMHVEVQPDTTLAKRQWETLREAYDCLGVQVHLAQPAPGLPDMVFTANAAVVHQGKAVAARFRHPERRPEEPLWRQWLEGHGLELYEPPLCQAFEGAGEALFLGGLLVYGWGFRSDEGVAAALAGVYDCEVLSLRLADPHYYHLDTCFSPLDARTALYYPPGFEEEGRRLLESRVERLIALDDGAAAEFACNAFPVGDTVVTSTNSPHLREELRRAGYDMRYVDMSEFRKAGGAVRCLTLQLSWPGAPSQEKFRGEV